MQFSSPGFLRGLVKKTSYNLGGYQKLNQEATLIANNYIEDTLGFIQKKKMVQQTIKSKLHSEANSIQYLTSSKMHYVFPFIFTAKILPTKLLELIFIFSQGMTLNDISNVNKLDIEILITNANQAFRQKALYGNSAIQQSYKLFYQSFHIVQKGKKLYQNIADGINGVIGWIKSGVQSLKDTLTNWVKQFQTLKPELKYGMLGEIQKNPLDVLRKVIDGVRCYGQIMINSWFVQRVGVSELRGYERTYYMLNFPTIRFVFYKNQIYVYYYLNGNYTLVEPSQFTLSFLKEVTKNKLYQRAGSVIKQWNNTFDKKSTQPYYLQQNQYWREKINDMNIDQISSNENVLINELANKNENPIISNIANNPNNFDKTRNEMKEN